MRCFVYVLAVVIPVGCSSSDPESSMPMPPGECGGCARPPDCDQSGHAPDPYPACSCGCIEGDVFSGGVCNENACIVPADPTDHNRDHDGGGPGADGATSDGASTAGPTGACGLTGNDLFIEDFELPIAAPFAPGYEQLPAALFPDDLCRWTQIQDTHPGDNVMAIVAAHGGQALRCEVKAGVGEEAVKMDLGRDRFSFRPGDVVVLRASFYVDAEPNRTFRANTLIDLEDSNDLRIRMEADQELTPAGAGLRLWVNEEGYIALNRGELLGSDAGEAPHFRLTSMTSEVRMPIGEWVTLEARIKLGVQVPLSADRPIDSSFDPDSTGAWAEIYLSRSGQAPELIVRQKGTTFLDRESGLPLLEASLCATCFEWPAVYDYDIFQVGCTNNRSNEPWSLEVDDVYVGR